MRGPKPTPTNIKEFRGNPGKRPLNREEPKPDQLEGLPDPPRRLKGEAKKEWYRIIGFVVKNRLIGSEGLSLLASYCNLHALIVADEKRGKLATAAMYGQYRTLASEFGLLPASRSRIKTGNAQENPEEKRFFG